MGVVYEADDRDRGTRVALKTLYASSAEDVFRIKHEFRALQDLQHPNLIRYGELFEESGLWFFTMELLPGVDFLSHVRPAARFARADPTARAEDVSVEAIPAPPEATGGADEAKLRAGLVQLAAGLDALHAAGKVHRDVKPSNVRVTPEGRVVLLDFGLVADRADEEQVAAGDVVGTAAYMAPEQAASKAVGPAADWYSVGVMLYEALTGRLPFAGTGLEIMTDKQRAEPTRPAELVPGMPADLDTLCRDLLRYDPGQRPDGSGVLARLRSEPAPRSAGSPSVSGASFFVGRRIQLEVLSSACVEVRRGETTGILVEGESGVGKSALVRHFVEGLRADDPRAVVLQGRCYEREAVPYKGFDGIIDALARYMRQIASNDAAALLPANAGLLPQVFPVLGRVDAIAQAPRPRAGAIDPQELRARVFAALRDLCAKLAERATLVLAIDDLQWADADSFALLGEIMRPPQAPALLLIATRRPLGDGTPDPAQALPNLKRLPLGRLQEAEAEALASSLLHRAGGHLAMSASSFALEAKGHPLFIDELIRHAAQGTADRPLQLDDALWARISGLDAPTRELLELVAVAGGPLAQETGADALAVGFDDFDRRLSVLRVANLARSTGSRRTDRVEAYHDRVREAVLAHLGGEIRRRWHERLARTLEGSGHADPELLAEHWQGAGDLERAVRHTEAAAQRSVDALAFDRAARLYRRVLELRPGDAAQRRTVHERLGAALVNAGRGAEAAEAFLAATTGATAAEALELRRRAAEQLLRSGHIDEGLAAVRNVLAQVGMSLTESPRAALAGLLVRRARLRLRGFGFRERDTSQVSAEELTRVDVCWSVAAGLAVADPLRGADFQTRNLLLALRAGEPYRVARALAMEGAFVAAAGTSSTARAADVLSRARALADRTGHPHAIGLAIGMAGLAAYLQGRWREALDRLDEADRILRDRCVGVAWELDTVQLFGLESLAYLGELRELDRRLALRLREAQDRGDLYALTHLRSGYLNCVWLARDDIEGARREAEAAMAGWSQTSFHTQHLYVLFAQTQIDLYRGDGAGAYRRVKDRWPAAARSLLFRVQFARLTFLHLRLRSTLMAASQAAAGSVARARLVREAEADVRRIARERTPYAQGWTPLAKAALLLMHDDRAAALAALDAAISALDHSDMRVYSAVATHCKGLLLDNPQGHTMAEQAAAFLRAQGVTNLARMVSVHAPGCTAPAVSHDAFV